MLEVKDLIKEYRPKKGNPVRAIDGISIKFPEKGMVFILGKSGSGKSTLLNLLGGLDTYDQGEIIIKGKSSKDFRQSEFDSYRNTYLGFIFQEYNILNDFNVAQNIALALQLQGEKATNERINEILKEVDLEGYGGRKPSELSGGQKQRVAIARALVKNPEIIMADEPTGALDSKTGLQVLDTLKKLSENKLVITITHDRDFAEMYGDRVIELKDGKIVSDIEKYSADAEKISDGVKITDNKIISIKKGYKLTEKDFAVINKYLQDNDMLISVDEKANGDLRRFARIKEDGRKESFQPTDEKKIHYSEESKFKPIKSRLPFKNTLKIGINGLKNKPVRLIFTILLSMVAFTLFGLTDTFAAYNKITATEKTIFENGVETAVLGVSKREKIDDDYFGTYSSKFSDEDIKEVEEKTGMQFFPVYENMYFSASAYRKEKKENMFYSGNDISAIMESDANYLKELGFTVYGKYPENQYEVAITSYHFGMYKEYGFENNEMKIEGKNIGDQTAFLARKPYFELYEKKYYITAIIDTKFDERSYEYLKDEEESFNIINYITYQELSNNLHYGYHCLLYVRNGFIQANNFTEKSVSMSVYSDIMSIYTQNVKKASAETGTYREVFFNGKTSLGDYEILIGIEKAVETIRAGKMREDEDTSEAQEIQDNISGYKNLGENFENQEEYSAYLLMVVEPFIEENKEYFTDPVNMYIQGDGYFESAEIGIAGIAYTDEISFEEPIFISDQSYEKIENSIKDIYPFLVKKGSVSKEEWKKLIRFHYGKQDETKVYSLENGYVSTLEGVNDFIESTSKIFLYIGIGFAVFAALMLTNFISTSISYKRREIGILRAVGARRSDVYGIFATESVIIALINFVLSVVATGVTASVITSSLQKEYNLSIRILNFGIRQIALIFGVAVVVALIASFIPTFRISRQKPVDAIKK